jgi:MraZ protein
VDQGTAPPARVKKPIGPKTTRVDDKGRMRLPVDIQRYWEESGKPGLLVTTFDEKVGRIYFMPDWEQVYEKLTSQRGDPRARHRFTMATHYGEEHEPDASGRLLVPAELRKKLALENEPVRLMVIGNYIELVSDKRVQYLLEEARTTADDAEEDLARLGI